MIKSFEKHYFECACVDTSDLMVISFDVDDNLFGKECYFSMQMNHYLPWYKRLLRATKYVFGGKSRYGHWGETVLRPKDTKRLQELFQQFHEQIGHV